MSKPSREEILWVMRERVAHLLIHRGRGRIAARIHELECMRAALRLLEAAWPREGAIDQCRLVADADGELYCATHKSLLCARGPWEGGHHFQEEDGYPGSLVPRKRGVP